MKKEISIIGAAIIDVLAGPVNAHALESNSQPVEFTKLSFGGDALNEATALSRLGKQVELISKVGDDETGAKVLAYIRENGMSTDSVKVEPGLETGMNIVLVDEAGERHFLTNPKGSLRKLTEADIVPHLDDAADIVSFASMFISPPLDIPAMERIFKRIKSREGRVLVADITKVKNGERLEDIKGLLSYVDYFLPNASEIEALTGESDPYVNAGLLLEAGVSCAVLKVGSKGCMIRTKDELFEVPAYPIQRLVDTTGAGDCFAAGFLWGLSQKLPLRDCGRFACAVASCNVEHAGAVEGIRSLEEPMQRYKNMAEK